MGSPFKMTPGKPGKGTARTTGSGLAMRGLVNPSSAPTHMHEGKAHPKSESLSKKAPSATIKSRKVVNKPGSVTTSKTKSSSGKKTTAAYDAAIKAEGTRILPKGQKSTKAMTDLYNAKRAKAKATDKANSASSSSSSKTVITQPSREVKESSKSISKGKSAYDIQKDRELINANSASRDAMNKEIAGNQASIDSSKAADKYRRGQVKLYGKKAMLDPAVTTKAVVRGNTAGRNSAGKSGHFTREEQNTMFNPNYGKATNTAGSQGYKNKSNGKTYKLEPGESNRTMVEYKSNIVPGSKQDVASTVKGNKKGSKIISKKDANAGTRGSRG